MGMASTSYAMPLPGERGPPPAATITSLFGKKQELHSALYLVSTPIGNLEDITVRALRVLSAADVVLAEDCRRTRMLLGAYGIHVDLRSYHMHNENQRGAEVVAMLRQGQVVALVSDAGTPGISDPGSRAVADVIAAGLRVVPIPGPTAAVAALVGSGLPTDEFTFVGFLPARSSARTQSLERLRQHVQGTMVFYVPPHGLLEVLADMVHILGGHRRCCVTRELTKIHETFHRATLQDAHAFFVERGVKGEITLCVQGSSDAEMQADGAQKKTVEERVQELLAVGEPLTAISKQVASEFHIRKKDAYAVALRLDSLQRPKRTG